MTDRLPVEPQLRSLDHSKLAAYCAALTERQFPNFILFSKLVEFGNTTQLETILDGVWQSLVPGGAKMNFEVQLDKVEANMPDLDEYEMYGATPALDAVVSLYSTLVCILEADVDEAIAVGNVSRECVAMFIELSEGDDQMSDEQIIRLISNHDLMVQEDEFHEEVIERLMSTKTMTKAFVSDLRELARNQGFSNIGISDDDH
ncbi:YjaG family protein [Neptunomonas phycophila]|uniref:YjaG family protein n=1 Tax=Neptunomonas phycophila TaxID=1572645 RepID=UPI001BEAC626|nr:YjaG family protein [Neptunomonas phycophila]MBT3145756.1 YjaG family protein [Neptunomonas phycophila]